MIKCKAVITETGDLAVEAVDCKLNMVQVACARFAILEKDEQVFNASKVKELLSYFEHTQHDNPEHICCDTVWNELKKELGIE